MIKFYDVTIYVSVNGGEKHYLVCSSRLLDETELQTEPTVIRTLPAWKECYERHSCFGLNVGYSFNRKKLKVYHYDTLLETVPAHITFQLEFSYKYEEHSRWDFNDLKYINGEKVIKFLKQEWERL